MSPQVSFDVRREHAGPAYRLIPTGELDIATAPILERAFDAAYESDDQTMIVVDLTELSFMDSTGINLLLRINAACKAADRLRIVNGSPAVVRVLDVSGVRRLLPIIASGDDPLTPLS
jgi:anti-sigma B factor antagonist